jgi:hypothetical protein
MTGPETRVRRADLDAVEMDGDLVMMGIEQGEYYALREVATFLWLKLDVPRTVAELCELVAGEFDTTTEGCRPDVEAFVGDLVEHRLATIVT